MICFIVIWSVYCDHYPRECLHKPKNSVNVCISTAPIPKAIDVCTFNSPKSVDIHII